MATEKRLIDAKALIAEICKQCGGGCDLNVDWCLPVDDLKKAPTVDAIEVVRCRDCKYSEPCKPHKKIWCPRIGRYLNADFYCAEGVKKDG